VVNMVISFGWWRSRRLDEHTMHPTGARVNDKMHPLGAFLHDSPRHTTRCIFPVDTS